MIVSKFAGYCQGASGIILSTKCLGFIGKGQKLGIFHFLLHPLALAHRLGQHQRLA